MAVIDPTAGYISGFRPVGPPALLGELGRVSDPDKWVRRIIDRYRLKQSKSTIEKYLRSNRITSRSDLDELFRRADVKWRAEYKKILSDAVENWRKTGESMGKYMQRRAGRQYSSSRRAWLVKAADSRKASIINARIKEAVSLLLAGNPIDAVAKQAGRNIPGSAAKKVMDQAIAQAKGKVQQAQQQAFAALPPCGLWDRIVRLFGGAPRCR